MARDRLTEARRERGSPRSGRSTRRSSARDYVIRTDGTFAETDAQVEAVYVALAEGRT